jgi:hypothetical protein
MSCRRYEKWIALASGGDLAGRKARRLEAHLAACQACRGFSEELGEARAVFLSAAEVEPADYGAIRAGVMARIASDRPRVPWWWGAAAVATAALVVATLWPRGTVVIPPAPAPPKPAPVAQRVEPPKPKAVVAAVKRVRRPKPAVEVIRPPQEDPERPAVVKMETNDPRVVVYWVMENSGDE